MVWRHLVSEVSMRGDHGWVGNVNLPIVVFLMIISFSLKAAYISMCKISIIINCKWMDENHLKFARMEGSEQETAKSRLDGI